MEILWYSLLFILLGTYVLLDGYDLGAGAAYIFFADTIEEKKKIIKSIRSVWDANEVWIFAFMLILYLVFPKFALSLFDFFGGYILLFLLFMLLKTLAFNLMITFESKKIKDFFGFLYGFFSVMMIIFIGVIIANILRGIYFDDQNELQFISSKFSPLSNQAGIFDWFTVLVTSLIFITILVHGLGWIVLKNKGAFNKKLKKAIQKLSFVLLILSIAFVISWDVIHPGIYKNFWKYPFLLILPFFYITSIFGLMGIRTYQGENKGFILSTNLIITGLLSIFALMFPRLSMGLDNKKITIYNSDFFQPERFYLQWWVIAIGLFLLIYSILIHKYNKGKTAD
jgi:cytochrome d ubiquinol oxidase subunit II